VKLADFGVAAHMAQAGQRDNVVGTPYWSMVSEKYMGFFGRLINNPTILHHGYLGAKFTVLYYLKSCKAFPSFCAYHAGTLNWDE
jgi:hypothetical protein